MEYWLENEFLKVRISSQGAELQELINKETTQNILWDGNPDFWGRKAPVLFPIVGKLKENTYYFEGKAYQLPQHGFARDHVFNLKESSEKRVVLVLSSSEQTKTIYPFDFELQITYILEGKGLQTHYTVRNVGSENMYFSIGAHPGFKVEAEDFAKYSLHFSSEEDLNRYKLDQGLLTVHTEGVELEKQKLTLTYSLFEEDALVFKNLKSETITLHDTSGKKVLSLRAKNFPFYGIWTKENAPFICLEPWHGVADSIDSIQLLSEKEGIIELLPHEVFCCEFEIEI
jgi:galactose mutarotase-like enzyme